MFFIPVLFQIVFFLIVVTLILIGIRRVVIWYLKIEDIKSDLEDIKKSNEKNSKNINRILSCLKEKQLLRRIKRPPISKVKELN